MKTPRVTRSRADLLAELQDQIALLVHACDAFDRGLKPIGKHIALSLRVLLHHHGQSRSLLEQLGLRAFRFLDTAGDLNPRNLATENPLCFQRIGTNSDYLPRCMGGVVHDRWIPFDRWWNNPVIKDIKGRRFHRRDLILNVADTDGGAHVDPGLDEAYLDLSRNNSLGWILSDGNVEQPFPPPVMPCVRQIAHELLETLRAKAVGSVAVNYVVQPVVQADGHAPGR